jgi:phosphotransferase system  glucose/maltose/N-acetylglucosamine-specific IIC component
MYVSFLATLLLAPLTLISLFFGRVVFVFALAFFSAMFVRAVLSLIWSWNKGEIREYGARICSRETSPVGFWSVLAFGVVAAAIALGFVALFVWLISNP